MKYQITTPNEVITINARLNKWGEIYFVDSLTEIPSMMNVKDRAPSLLARMFKLAKRLGGKLRIVGLADGNIGNRKLRY